MRYLPTNAFKCVWVRLVGAEQEDVCSLVNSHILGAHIHNGRIWNKNKLWYHAQHSHTTSLNLEFHSSIL
jgi:hypothetical protein